VPTSPFLFSSPFLQTSLLFPSRFIKEPPSSPQPLLLNVLCFSTQSKTH